MDTVSNLPDFATIESHLENQLNHSNHNATATNQYNVPRQRLSNSFHAQHVQVTHDLPSTPRSINHNSEHAHHLSPQYLPLINR
jgi:hypothetical protein